MVIHSRRRFVISEYKDINELISFQIFSFLYLGSEEFDKFLIMALTNPSFFGGLVAFILDNTVKGKMTSLLYVYKSNKNVYSKCSVHHAVVE